MVRSLLVLGTLLALHVIAATPAGADPQSPSPSSQATVHAGPNGLLVNGGTSTSSQAVPGGSEDIGGMATLTTVPVGEWVRANDPCDTVAASGCVVGYTCADTSVPEVWLYVAANGNPLVSYSKCPQDPPPTASTTVTPTIDIPAEVLKAFKRVDLPASDIAVQPPGGKTLVNFETILSTEAARHQIAVQLDKVNLKVTLEVWPSHFLWHHGDNTTQESIGAGKYWTEGADVETDADFITHRYLQTRSDIQVSVDTTWSAQFRVGGAAQWRAVNGTVTKTGTPARLTVVEAIPKLVT